MVVTIKHSQGGTIAADRLLGGRHILNIGDNGLLHPSGFLE
jgi:hypothetical protein